MPGGRCSSSRAFLASASPIPRWVGQCGAACVTVYSFLPTARSRVGGFDSSVAAVTGPAYGLALGRPIVWGEGLDDAIEEVETGFVLPAGTVTFLLSDIEGSTRLWGAQPDAMALAVPVHYALLSGAVGRHGGVRPVEQGEGDSIVAAFSRASDAVAAALEAQRAFAAQVWPGELEMRVRIALHTAEAQLRDEGNYFGVALSRCARLRAIAHGGQTLLSRGVHDLVVERLPDGVELVDLGTHRLPDLGRPEHVFGLHHPDLPESEEPLRSLDAVPNNLPERLTSFVGRERELREVVRALSDTRLLTVTGAGGCGKTRLAAQAAADSLDRFPDGVWWVELAPLSDPDAIGPTLGEAVGVRPLPGQTSLGAAVTHLAGARALVVLDNCEHLLESCARTAEALLRGCHDVAVMATSRAPLGVDGEATWRVPSLSLPAELSTEPVAVITQSDAVRLFIERALKVRPNFAVNAGNAPAISQICHDLDGIPLAIELAAARTRVLGVEQISAALGDRFHLLTGGARSAMPRQQTLRASVDWSHELLGENERLLFRRLAVFAGGWTLDSVEQVCAGGGLDRMAILDLLTSLVDRSLVVVDDHGASMRYRLLETVRQYARDRLSEAGELAAVRERHRDAYLARAEKIAPHLEAAGQTAWLDVLDADAANFAVALEHAAITDVEKALRLCVALTVWWKLRGRFALADTAYLHALGQCAEERSALRARVLWARGYLLTYGGRFDEAVASELEALEIAQSLGDASTAARALDVLGTLQLFPDPVGARDGLEQARSLARTSGDEWCLVDATQILACTWLMQADPRAVDVFEEALEIIDRTGYAEFAAWHWWGVGIMHYFRGRDEEALAHYERAIALADAVGEPVTSGHAHAMRAMIRIERGRGEDVLVDLGPVLERSIAAAAGLAIPVLHQAIACAQASVGMLDSARASLTRYVEQGADGGVFGMAIGLLWLARTELALDQLDAVADHATQALDIARALSNPAIAATADHARAAVALRRGDARQAERLAHEALALAVEHDLTPNIAPSLELLAQTAAAFESYHEAARILGAAERVRGTLGRVRWPPEQTVIEQLADQLHAALPDRTFGEALAQGRTMTTSEAIAWLRRARGTRKRPASGWESLTPTELKVVELAAQGLTNPEIGKRLFISRGTAKIHLSHIYAKLDVRNRSELAVLAARRDEQQAIITEHF
jgi:predicted ATPase/class 3 adenylate cyclase/DNA-binding CsgD family transcriptional regulator